MQTIKEYIMSLVEQGGPEPSQYDELNNWFRTVGGMIRNGEITQDQVRELWLIFGDVFTEDTMQSFVCKKPHGYAGDYELIDRLYTEWVSPKQHLKKWDYFSHWQAAAVAVRNRKEYFIELLSKIDGSEVIAPSVLIVGSGPCRDIYEYHQQYPSTKIHFECLDMDKNAIEYSKGLVNGNNVDFTCQNAFRFRPDKKYDLIWSAGLFDYLDDRQFVYLLRLLFSLVASNGKLIIGNFSTSNPSRDYMEFGEWFLNHRSEKELAKLAETSGICPKATTIDTEPCGVNLFVHIDNVSNRI